MGRRTQIVRMFWRNFPFSRFRIKGLKLWKSHGTPQNRP
jgi:hypothetical protein